MNKEIYTKPHQILVISPLENTSSLPRRHEPCQPCMRVLFDYGLRVKLAIVHMFADGREMTLLDFAKFTTHVLLLRCVLAQRGGPYESYRERSKEWNKSSNVWYGEPSRAACSLAPPQQPGLGRANAACSPPPAICFF